MRIEINNREREIFIRVKIRGGLLKLVHEGTGSLLDVGQVGVLAYQNSPIVFIASTNSLDNCGGVGREEKQIKINKYKRNSNTAR